MVDSAQHKEVNARKLIFLRKKFGKSQKQIADKLHIKRERYDSYEDARSVAPYRVIRDLCNFYKITLDEFENLKILVTPCNKA